MIETNNMIEGPIEFTADIDIDRPAADVFPLIDVANPRFRSAQSGAIVKRVEGTEDRFEMVIEGLETVFKFHVTERIEGEKHALISTMEPQLFALAKSVETHEIEPTSDSSCKVTLKTFATFDSDLSIEQLASEAAMMSRAVVSELEKLKTLAEEGMEGLKAMEDAEMGFCFDFDLNDLDVDWDDIEAQH
ncbi:hypothetical protein INR77_12305 [Erythrobacter sp. SCSIO 43205]|uniref:hypothetical protein n=1 Tax=Erythrobacter sp. SCSIO 43205 TaxID=2779361 RepID=UPI001CAA313F|nr:hypothetical protein [Erythrobacter sp. SCSIO 43205]UAB77566.1 hypothetical protein INR77_12305 [Erythrobacter sp. SCSIO 43205]